MHFQNDTQTEYSKQTFEDVDLSQGYMVSKEFFECVFKRCTFMETVLRKCRFDNCEFKHCDLSLLSVTDCSFTDTVFKDSKVIGVNWTEASWPRWELFCPIKFIKCSISHSTFMELNLREITIRNCIAIDVDFRGADLTQADLTHTDFTDSLFINTNLTRADFTHSRNYHINASLNKIEKAKFSLPEALDLLYGLDIILVDTEDI